MIRNQKLTVMIHMVFTQLQLKLGSSPLCQRSPRLPSVRWSRITLKLLCSCLFFIRAKNIDLDQQRKSCLKQNLNETSCKLSGIPFQWSHMEYAQLSPVMMYDNIHKNVANQGTSSSLCVQNVYWGSVI